MRGSYGPSSPVGLGSPVGPGSLPRTPSACGEGAPWRRRWACVGPNQTKANKQVLQTSPASPRGLGAIIRGSRELVACIVPFARKRVAQECEPGDLLAKRSNLSQEILQGRQVLRGTHVRSRASARGLSRVR